MWRLKLSGEELISLDCGRNSHDYSVIETVLQEKIGLLFSSIKILQNNQELHVLKGVKKDRVSVFVEQFQSRKTALLTRRRIAQEKEKLEKDYEDLLPCINDLKRSLRTDIYFSARWREKLLSIIAPYIDDVRDCLRRAHLDYFEDLEFSKKIQSKLGVIVRVYDYPLEIMGEINRRFVANEISEWGLFFDNLETYSLSKEQKAAAVTFEENTLLNAAAGSGKTSTVVARVVYMLAKGIQPEDIICLAFNAGAKDEIGERIEAKVAKILKTKSGEILQSEYYDGLLSVNPKKVHCRTFHGLGRSIIEAYRGKPYPRHAISNPTQSENRFKRALELCMAEHSFQLDWVFLQTVLRFPEPEVSRFKSEYEYNQYLQSIYEKKQQSEGVLSLGTSKLVKSSQEVSISNWLYIQGIDFEYERPFEEGSDYLECSPNDPWIPDFSYKLPDGTVIIHEHFGLDKDGKAPSFFDNPEFYEENSKSKKAALKALNTLHFWTSSAQFYDETIFLYLEEALVSRGIKVAARTYDDIKGRLDDIGQEPDFDIITKAVSQIRANGLQRDELSSRVKMQPNTQRAKRFLNVCFSLADKIDQFLDSEKQIDFDAMMCKAIEKLSSDEEPKKALPPYRYFIVDEFQDTAPGRAKLVQLLRQRDQASKLFVVGDDWQSINRFAGSDLRYFTDFGDHFNHLYEDSDHCLELTETRRCPKGINDIARAFITSTRHLSNKEVVTKGNSMTQGVIDILSVKKDGELPNIIESTLSHWHQSFLIRNSERPEDAVDKPTVMILGRYSAKYIKGISDNGYIDSLGRKWSEYFDFIGKEDKKTGLKSIYHTVHRSKGLEADYILVVGLNDVRKSVFSFPSERESDPLLALVSPASEPVPDAEDRRLFYVALTRAKKQVVLCADYYSPSNYATTLLRDNRDGSVLFNSDPTLPELCHRCKKGVFYREFKGKNGRNSYYRCSNQAGCKATKTIR